MNERKSPYLLGKSALSKQEVSDSIVKNKSPNGTDMLCRMINFTSDGRVNMRTYIHAKQAEEKRSRNQSHYYGGSNAKA
jgi:hypothetical protein